MKMEGYARVTMFDGVENKLSIRKLLIFKENTNDFSLDGEEILILIEKCS